jgi:hypothetical protein
MHEYVPQPFPTASLHLPLMFSQTPTALKIGLLSSPRLCPPEARGHPAICTGVQGGRPVWWRGRRSAPASKAAGARQAGTRQVPNLLSFASTSDNRHAADQSHYHGRQGHDQHRSDQRSFAAQLVPEMPQDRSAHRPGHQCCGKRPHRDGRGRRRTRCGTNTVGNAGAAAVPRVGLCCPRTQRHPHHVLRHRAHLKLQLQTPPQDHVPSCYVRSPSR